SPGQRPVVRPGFTRYLVVISTECRRSMNDTGSVFRRYKIPRNHAERILRILIWKCIRQELFISDSDELLPFGFGENPVWNLLRSGFEVFKIGIIGAFKIVLSELLSDKAFRQDYIHRKECVLIESLHQHIVNLRPYRKRGVARKRPRGCRPG